MSLAYGADGRYCGWSRGHFVKQVLFPVKQLQIKDRLSCMRLSSIRTHRGEQ